MKATFPAGKLRLWSRRSVNLLYCKLIYTPKTFLSTIDQHVLRPAKAG